MSEIKEVIGQLRERAQYYIGIPEQHESYTQLLDRLRELYQIDDSGFSKSVIDGINEFKKEIKNKEDSNEKPLIDPSKPVSLKNGAVVFHKYRYFVGVIDDTTNAKKLFEDPGNDKEYRVRVSKSEVKIASPKNLLIVGSAYNKRCYNCKGYVGYSLERCKRCGWYICLFCGCCGCAYKGPIHKD